MHHQLHIEFAPDVPYRWCSACLRNLDQSLIYLDNNVEAGSNFQSFEIHHSNETVNIYFRLGEKSDIYDIFDTHRHLRWIGLHSRHTELSRSYSLPTSPEMKIQLITHC